MKIPEEIKSKVKEFLAYIENTNNIKSDDAINKFKELFKDQYIEDYECVDETYFQSQTKNYYIKNGYGLTLQVNSGSWDRYGSKVSHEGKDIVIYSSFSKVKEYREGCVLFFEDEKHIDKLPKNIYEVFNIDLSKSSMIDNAKDNKGLKSVYKILPDNIKNSEEIVFERYLTLKKFAEKVHRDEKDDAYVAPYDVTVHYTEELLMEYIEKFSDNKYFKDRAFALFYCEFGDYFNREIKKCENAIHIIENQDKYKMLIDEKNILEFDKEYVENIEETMKEKQKEIDDLINEYNTLKKKRYNLFEIITHKPKIDKERILVLEGSAKIYGSIEYEKADLSFWQSVYNDFQKSNKDLVAEIKKLEQELVVPFEDYSKAYEWEEYEKGWEITSLNKLVEMKDTFMNKLADLQSEKQNAEIYKEYVEKFLQKNKEKMIELNEEDCMEM